MYLGNDMHPIYSIILVDASAWGRTPRIDEEFQLSDAVRLRLIDNALLQRRGCAAALMRLCDEEGSDLRPVLRAFQAFPTIAAKADQLAAGEYASRVDEAKDPGAGLEALRLRFLLRQQKAERITPRALNAERAPG